MADDQLIDLCTTNGTLQVENSLKNGAKKWPNRSFTNAKINNILEGHLKRLRLRRIIEILPEMAQKAAKEDMDYTDFLASLIEEEITHKQARSVQTKINLSKFPYIKTIEDFNFEFQPSINRKKFREVAKLGFIDRHENAIFLGPPGVGKTHLAIGLGIKACEAGYKVMFTTLTDLSHSLYASLVDNSLEERMRSLSVPAILIIDEIGYLPLNKQSADFLFQLVSRRYEKGSIIITSNKSFNDWGNIFGDTVIASAILDRLLHHCHVFNIKGESYRLKEKRNSILKEEVVVKAQKRCFNRCLSFSGYAQTLCRFPGLYVPFNCI